MATPVSQKLKIKEGFTLLTIHAPAGFETMLEPLPAGVNFIRKGKDFQQVHWFVLNKAQLEAEMEMVLKLVTGDVLCWTYYPKGSSKMATDLTRDKGWEKLLEIKHLQWITLVSLNDTWSTFAFRIQTEADKKKAVKEQVREIFGYINTEKKEVRLPEDLAEALAKNNNEAAFFNSLSFSNKKEYVEWVITAKREETRKARVSGTIERLAKSWRNPKNI